MAKTKYELDTRILAVFFLAAAPFMALGAYLLVNMAKGRLKEAVGASLEQRAVGAKLSLERYVGEQIVHARLLSLDPVVRSAVFAPAAAADPEERRRLEQAWATGSDAALVSKVIDSPAVGRLRQLASIRPAFRLLQVVGPTGQLVASTARAGRLQQAEKPWFKALSPAEAGERAFIGDIQAVTGSPTGVLEIAYPMRDTEGNFLGGVRALVDAADLYGVLAPVRLGATGHAVLMRSTDGLVLASDESERMLKEVFPGFDSLQGAVEGFPLGEHGQALFGKTTPRQGYWTIPKARAQGPDGKDARVEPARLVGFTPVDQLPDVKWMVAVEQNVDEAMAPVASVTRYLWLHFLGAFVTVILLALYFSFKVERPIIEEELHLHEEHVPAGGHPSGT